MKNKLTPKKHKPDREHRAKGRWRDRIRLPESVLEAAVGLQTPDLSIPWYRRERFQKITGLSGAVAGAILAFIPGAGPLGEIVGGAGLASWSTAAQFHRIKKRRAANERTWWDLVLEIINKILKTWRR